jgi:ribosomal protein S18 acetylase RimI-like enzyme
MEEPMANSDACLSNPIWHTLTSHHASMALGNDLARRYPRDVAAFGAVAAYDENAFHALAVIPSGEVVVLLGGHPALENTWKLTRQFTVTQMVYEGQTIAAPASSNLITPLTAADVPAMLELVDLTHPGPFMQRTIELGRYFAIWQDGRLAAMAGERFHLPGYHEISAACTHPDFQRRGYARQLILQLMHKIQSEGDVPFLHVVSENTGAIALYEKLGFKQSRELPLFVLKRQ